MPIRKKRQDQVYLLSRSNGSQTLNHDKLESVLRLGSQAMREIVKTQCGNDITECNDLQQQMLSHLQTLKAASQIQDVDKTAAAFVAAAALMPEPSNFYLSHPNVSKIILYNSLTIAVA